MRLLTFLYLLWVAVLVTLLAVFVFSCSPSRRLKAERYEIISRFEQQAMNYDYHWPVYIEFAPDDTAVCAADTIIFIH